MMLQARVRYAIFGFLFGALLGGMYALATQAVNWIFLPGIPLLPPEGGLSSYLFQHSLLGALLGTIIAFPANRYLGMLAGGITAQAYNMLMTLFNAWGGVDFERSLVTVGITCLPMVVLMLPVAFIVRLGVDAQDIDPDRPYLWGRRYLIPLVVALVAVFLGTLSLHGPDVRRAFVYTDTMLREGLQAASPEVLPVPLQDVKSFPQEAQAPYALAYSDQVETFMGPVPAGAELSQFLIIARFQNGFTLACVFSSNRKTPNCTNY